MTEFNTFSLRQAADYDHRTNAKERLTLWGKISQDRRERGISKKARRLKKEQEAKNGK